MKLSKYVNLSEATKSQTATRKGIKNEPSEEQLEAMKFVSKNIFDKVRDHINGPLFPSSFFRSPELNSAIGGATSSQHCKGQAIDIDADFYGIGSNVEIFYFIKNSLTFDQLIWEFGTASNPDWVHVSLREDGNNRGEVLRCFRRDDGRTQYIPFDLREQL
jgi:zinc D-Ala-D-Ala carboxypeptidase